MWQAGGSLCSSYYSGTRMSHTACCWSWLLLFFKVHNEQYPVVTSQVLLIDLFVLRDIRIKGKGRWRRGQKEMWFNYRTPCVVSTSGLKWNRCTQVAKLRYALWKTHIKSSFNQAIYFLTSASVSVLAYTPPSPVPCIVSRGKDKTQSNYCNSWSKLGQCPRQIQLRHRIAAHLMIWGNLRLHECAVPGRGCNHITTLFLQAKTAVSQSQALIMSVCESTSWTQSELRDVIYASQNLMGSTTYGCWIAQTACHIWIDPVVLIYVGTNSL